VNAFVAAGAGFLAAVLWFDLMFDVQVARHRDGALPEPVLAIGLAGARIVPNAVRLGARQETRECESGLARAIFRGHVFCLFAMVGVLAVQLGFG